MEFNLVADNLRESFRIIASSRGVGELRELPGVSIAAAGATFQMFNTAFLSTPLYTERELKQRILRAIEHFDERGQEWAYWVCEDRMEPAVRRRSRRIFEHHGLRLATDLPGMLAESILPPAKPLPYVDVQRVCAGHNWEAFCDVGSVCFHVPITWFREVFDSDRVWDGFMSFVGYVDGEPVATTSVVSGAGVLGVYNVATLPGHQRHGYGEAVMRHAVAEAHRLRGPSRVILQSTPAGLRLYQRMGFREVARVSVYSS
ncbi:MAG: GNAT family N-acetyltransferase [Candidatus Solibacter sp.]